MTYNMYAFKTAVLSDKWDLFFEHKYGVEKTNKIDIGAAMRVHV